MKFGWVKTPVLAGVLSFIIVMGMAFNRQQGHRKSAGAPVGRTGAPGEYTCNKAGCHDDHTLNSGPGNLSVQAQSDSVFYPGRTHQLTVEVTQPKTQKFGFQAVILRSADTVNVGSLKLNDGLRTQLISPDDTTSPYYGRTYITHTLEGNSAVSPDTNRWHFKWRAPDSNTDTVTIFVAAVAANGNEVETRDSVYTTSLTLSSDTMPTGYPDNENQTSEVVITPHPLSGQSAMLLPHTLSEGQLQIFSPTGQLVYERQFSHKRRLILRENWVPKEGVYLFRIRSAATKAFTGKVVVR